jgi:hypothetical protein
MILIDTGYIVALLNPRDELHARAVAWAAAVDVKLAVTEHVIVEAVNFFSKPINRLKVNAFVAQLLASPDCELIPASAELLQTGLELHAQRPDKEWSLTDCFSFVVMERRSITHALTHDHHFEQAGFEALLRRDPEP